MSERKMTQFESLTDSIASVIRSRILNGEYKIGEKIKETHVAEELRVSRTPIRKAFKEKIGCEGLTIGNPRHYSGRTVIPSVYNGLEVIIAPQLRHFA